MNYTTTIDRVEQLSLAYSDLKDKHIKLKNLHSGLKEINKELRSKLDESSGKIVVVEKTYDWDVIKKDDRVKAHFLATKKARLKNSQLKKQLTEMTNKYLSLRAKYEPI